MRTSLEEASLLLKQGKIGVIPTDTVYGIVALSSDLEAVERLYRTRGRDEDKPCILLIGDVEKLEDFSCFPPQSAACTWESLPSHEPSPVSSPRISSTSPAVGERSGSSLLWPGPVSIVLSCEDPRWAHIHRGSHTLAFRLPRPAWLRTLLRQAGPIIAPSANPQGMPPSKTIEEAERYFGTTVDFYVDGGALDNAPSTVVRIEGETMTLIRQGSVPIPARGGKREAEGKG